MLTQRDAAYVTKLAPIAQLLEILGHLDHPSVRSPDVFLAMSREVWATYVYLSARLHDEMLDPSGEARDEAYFLDLERRALRGLE